jgi:hypothetical protein
MSRNPPAAAFRKGGVVVKSWKRRDTHLAELFGASADRSVQAALGASEDDIPQPILDWLARLRLLYGVPFEYLVADARMMPTESIRFFFVDRNWTDRLVDGAMSIGSSSSRHLVQNAVAADGVRRGVDRAEPCVRAQLRNKPPPEGAVEDGLISGFLLRSIAVSGWPGIEVAAYTDVARTQPLQLVRIDRLAPDLLFCLFSGSAVPACVLVREPPETLHFGVQTQDQSQHYAFLRGLGYGGFPAGVQLPDRSTQSIMMRGDGSSGVIDVWNTVNSTTPPGFAKTLTDKGVLNPAITFGGAEFAVEMVRSAGEQPFVHGTAALPKAERRRLTFFLRGRA